MGVYRYGDGAYGATATTYGTRNGYTLRDFQITCGIDWTTTSGPLTATPTYTDVSADVLIGRGVTLKHGRGPESRRADVGTATFTLNNEDGKYTPDWRTPNPLTAPFTVYSDIFETGIRTWSSTAVTAAISTDTAKVGLKSMKLTAGAAGLSSAYPPAQITAAGVPLTLTMWMQTTGPRTCSLAMVFSDGTTTSTVTGPDVTVSDEWTLMRMSAVVPAGMTSVRLEPRWVSTGAGDVLYVDELQLDARPRLDIGRPVRWQITAPGDTARTIWTGATTDYQSSRENGWLGVTQVQAADRLAAYGSLILTDTMTADQRRTGAVVMFPLDEGDTTGASDAIRGQRSLTAGPNRAGRDGSISIEQRWDGYGALRFTSSSTTGAATWLQAANPRSVLAPMAEATLGTTWECFVKPTSATGATPEGASLIYLADADSSLLIGLRTTTGIYATVTAVHTPSGTNMTVTGTFPLPSDAWSHIALIQTNPGFSSFQLWVNGELDGTLAGPAGSPLINPAAAATVFGIGNYGITGTTLNAAVSCVAAHPFAVSTGGLYARSDYIYGGSDTPFARFSRLTGLAVGPVPAPAAAMAPTTTPGDTTVYIQGNPETLQPIGDTKGQALLDLLDPVASTCGGVVYADPSGVLRLADVAMFQKTVPAVTLDASTMVDPSSVTASLSTQSLANDITVTQQGGAVARVQDEISISSYGRKSLSDQTASTRYDHAGELASWLLAVNTQPRLVTPQLTVNVLAYVNAGGSFPALAALTVGSLIRVSNLPGDAPWVQVDLLVDGVEWRIGANELDCTLTVSPGLPFTVARLDSTITLGSGARLGL